MSAIELSLDAAPRTMEAATHHIRAFYSRPIGWVALVVHMLFVAYAGGAVMFWFHCFVRQEQGPPVNNWYHWMTDCTLCFVGLSIAMFFVLPTALTIVSFVRNLGERTKQMIYVALVGVLFALATFPGPYFHDLLVGRGTPGAQLVVDVWGYNASVARATAHNPDHSWVIEGLLQVLLGIPVYAVASLIAFRIVRAIASRSRRV